MEPKSPIQKTSELLDCEQLAAKLNVKVSKVRSMVFRREIPSVKIGRLVRFDSNSINEWLKSNAQPICAGVGHGKN